MVQKRDRFSIIKILKEIFHYLPQEQKRKYFFIVFLMILTTLFETAALGAIALLISTLTSPETIINSEYIFKLNNMFNFQIINSTENLVVFACVLVAVLFLFKNGIKLFWLLSSAKYSLHAQGYFGDILLQKILNSDYNWFVKENPSELVNAVNWRVYIGIYLTMTLTLLNDILLIVFVLVGLFLLETSVSLIVIFILGGGSLLIFLKIKRKIDKEAQNASNLNRESFIQASKAVNGIKDIKISLKEKQFSEMFSSKVYSLVSILKRQRVLADVPTLVLETSTMFILALTIFIVLSVIGTTTSELFSTVTLFAIAAWRLMPASARMSNGFTRIRTSIPYIKTVFKYLETTPLEIMSPDQNIKKFNFKDEIDVQNISYSYSNNEEYALQGVSCKIKSGETIGIIGHSGAGKSTLVDLLIGLLNPDKGTLRVDGLDLRNNIRHWRKLVGYVPQFPYIFDGTLLENIAFGETSDCVERQKIHDVCKMAAMDFLDQLSKGIDTIIGERGIRLSGGQRQRIAIARALYKDPQVLIFDEATSSLDTKSEKEIQKTIYSFKKSKTLFIISHRLSTVEDCDKIIWLENGKLIKMGNTKILLDTYSSHYKRFDADKQ